MTTIQQYKDCSTAGLRALDLQLIHQIQRIAPGALDSFADLRVSIGAGCHPYLQAPAVTALERAIAQRGKTMIINSAYRTIAQQAVLYAHFQNRTCGIRAAARPGVSNHNTGLALDIEDAQGWRPYLERYGWDWIGSFDPMHFDYEGSGTRDLKWLSIKAFQQLWNLNHPSQPIAEDGIWGIGTYRALCQTPTEGFKHVPGQAKRLEVPTTSKTNPLSGSLRHGMKSDDVLLLQRVLSKTGATLAQDGNFGVSTVAAVKAFQLAHGLVADGVVGVATKKALGIS